MAGLLVLVFSFSNLEFRNKHLIFSELVLVLLLRRKDTFKLQENNGNYSGRNYVIGKLRVVTDESVQMYNG